MAMIAPRPRPAVDDGVAAIVPVVAQRRRDERERGWRARVEVAQRADLALAVEPVGAAPQHLPAMPTGQAASRRLPQLWLVPRPSGPRPRLTG